MADGRALSRRLGLVAFVASLLAFWAVPAIAATTTYTSEWTGGTIEVGDTVVLSEGATVTGSIINNGTLAYDQAGSLTLSSSFSGTGSLVFTNSGTLRLLNGQTPAVNAYVTLGSVTHVPYGTLMAGDSGNYRLFVGYGGTGSLNIDGGCVFDTYGLLGVGGGSYGEASISSGTWATQGDLSVGASGTGKLSLTGGFLSASTSYIGEGPGSNGTATITGGTWANQWATLVGNHGNGTLNVAGGSLTNGNVYIGYYAGVPGTATVTGGTWTAGGSSSTSYGYFYVGHDGEGVLNLAGGSIFNRNGRLGYKAGSLGHATVTSGTWVNSVNLDIASSGSGRLTLAGGYVSAGTGYIAANAGSRGAVLVTGGTLAYDSSLYVGYVGTGTMNLAGGAVTSGSCWLGYWDNSRGTVSVTSGTWRNRGDLVVGVSGSGTLNIATGGLVEIAGSLSSGWYGSINLLSGGTLQIGTGGTTGVLLSGTGNFTNGGTLILSRSDPTTFAGVISGTGALTKAGTGLVSLTGNNTYSGLTTVAAGTLSIGNGGSTGAVLGDISNNASLVFNKSISHTYAGVLSGTGPITKRGSMLLTLTGTNLVEKALIIDQPLTVLSGSLNILSSGAGDLRVGSSGNGSLELAGGSVANRTGMLGKTNGSNGVATIASGTWRNSGDLYVGVSGTGVLTISSGGVVVVSGTLTRGPLGTIRVNAGGTLQVGDGGTNGLLLAGTGSLASDGATVFNRANASEYSGVLSGAGSLSKIGSGLLSLSGANSYTGGTTISGGTLSIGNGGTSGSITGDVVNDATLAFNRSDDSSFTSTVWGTGSIVKLGAGLLRLTGTTTHSGGTQVSKGTMVIGNGGTAGALLGSSEVTIASSATLGFNRSDEYTFTGSISGQGAVTNAGSGLLTWMGDASHLGGTILSGGTLSVGNGNTTGSIDGNIVNNAQLIFKRSDSYTYAGTLSGTGVVTKMGSGLLTLAGTGTTNGSISMDYTTTVRSGTLSILSSGTGDVRVGDSSYGAINVSGGRLTNRTCYLGYSGNAYGSATLNTGTWSQNSLYVGYSGSGTLKVLGGALSTGTCWVGYGADSSGNVSVTSGTWTNTGNLTVGSSGSAGLSVADGGVVVVGGNLDRGARGSINLNPGGTLQIGTGGPSGGLLSGTGSLVNNGSLVFNRADNYTFSGIISGPGVIAKMGSNTLTFANMSNLDGSLQVRSGAVSFQASGVGDLRVGYTTSGSLTLTGGNVNSRNGYVGFSSGGAGVVSVSSGAWANSGNIYVGYTNLTSGTLSMSGGTVSNVNAWLGFGAGSRAAAAITGGAWTNTGNLNIGTSGSGTLTISSSGTVVVSGSLTMGGRGTINLDPGGTLQIGTGGTTGVLLSGTGSLTNNGSLVFNRSDRVVHAGSISGSGSLQKTGAGVLTLSRPQMFTGPTTIRQGTIELAHAEALAYSTVTPATGGSLAISPYIHATLGGLNPEAGGLVDVGRGAVTVTSGLTGNALVAAILVGQDGGTWRGKSGITSTAAADDVARGTQRAVGWRDNGDGSMTFSYAAPGDANLDGVVDVLDAANLLTGNKYDTGSVAWWSEGDFTYDGIFDVLDTTLFLSTGLFDKGPYNTAATGAASTTVIAVPEPSALTWVAASYSLACLFGTYVRRLAKKPR